MNDENRAVKVYIKNLAPVEAMAEIERYKLPSPHKQILIALVNRKEGYPACDFLESEFKIHIGYWSYIKKLKEALEMFRKSKQFIQKISNN